MKNKLLGIDHGQARIGLAISDKEQIMAIPLKAIESTKNIFDEIKQICQQEDIKKIIVGLPLALSGENTKQTNIVRSFAGELKKRLDVDIVFEDERLTSKMARQIFDREDKDTQAAVIILQNYLDKQNR